jgi:RNA polymerase sigma factor (sigma-70 family)
MTRTTVAIGGAVFGGVGEGRVVSVDEWVSGLESTPHDTMRVTPDEGDLTLVVAEARAGSGEAWENLIRRFGGLVAVIARRCRLNDADVAEVCQTTWLRLVENLDRIEQPERLGAWLATTSKRESLRIATRRSFVSLTDAVYLMADDDVDPLDSALLRDEQVVMIRMAAQRLAPHCQRLLGLLMGDDDLPYKEIAEQLNMPIGSIGPTRGRCLAHLRQILAETELSQTSA